MKHRPSESIEAQDVIITDTLGHMSLVTTWREDPVRGSFELRSGNAYIFRC